MGNLTAYIILIIAVALGTAANGFAKSAQGYRLIIPSFFTNSPSNETPLSKSP